MTRLVLFDIDGTLVLTGRAGVRALKRAGESLFGTSELFDDIPVAGRTDWIILQDAVRRIGRELDAALLAELRREYLAHLEEEILKPGEGVKAVMPGVRALLPALDAREDVLVGLLTGNFAEGARIKLEHFDLWSYFKCGAFGDDAPDRNALVPFAIERARSCGVDGFAYRDVIVIGDTPNDVACAQAVGAIPVAVATGGYSVDELRRTGAPIVLDDLSDTERLVALIERGVS